MSSIDKSLPASHATAAWAHGKLEKIQVLVRVDLACDRLNNYVSKIFCQRRDFSDLPNSV